MSLCNKALTSKSKFYAHFILGSIAGITLSQANGILPYSFGGKSAGMGGAGIALPKDATDGDVNPSLMGLLDNEAVFTPAVVHEDKSINTSKAQVASAFNLPPQTETLKNKLSNYLVGAYGGGNYRLNSEWTAGVTMSGGGGKTKYKSSVISPALSFPHKLGASAALLSPNLAWKPTKNQAYGVAPILAVILLKGDLPTPTFTRSRGANKRELKPGYGFRIGGFWKVHECLSLGASASTPVFMKKMSKYRDALPHALNIPAIIGAGIAWNLPYQTIFLLDFYGTFWKEVKATGNSPSKAGQGWKNVLSIKMGLQHQLNEQVIIRAGYAYESLAIPKNQLLFNALPAANSLAENTLTIGTTYIANRCLELDFALAYVLPKKLTDDGTGFMGPLTKGIRLKSSQVVAFAGFRWKF